MEGFGSAEAIQQLGPSLQRLLRHERFNLHRLDVFQSKIRDSDFDPRYLPQNCNAFPLPCFLIPRKHFYVYGQQAHGTDEMSVFDGLGSDGRILFPIHPTALPEYRQFLSDAGAHEAPVQIWAVPTSSVRTLLAWPDGAPEKALFIKTSLHCPVFGDRRLSLRKVGCSVGLSSVVRQSKDELPDVLGFCWESVGYVPRGVVEAGVIIRSIPAEFMDNRALVVPLFALLGGDESNPPVFLRMFKRNEKAAREFLEQVVCARFARLWLSMSMLHGLIPEAHGQDLIVTLSADDFSFRQFFYRDFEGLQVDWDLRRNRRIVDDMPLPRAFAWYETYGSWGYAYAELTFYKLITSLDQYMHFVIREFDRTLTSWQQRGFIDAGSFDENYLSIQFSRQMSQAVHDLFGVQIPAADSIHQSIKRFVIRLMKLRRKLLLQSPDLSIFSEPCAKDRHCGLVPASRVIGVVASDAAGQRTVSRV